MAVPHRRPARQRRAHPHRHHSTRRSTALSLALTLGVVAIVALAPDNASAGTLRPTLSRDSTNQTLTLTGGGLRLVLSYAGQATVSSFELNGTELLEAGMFSTAQTTDGASVDSRDLATDPTVTVEGTSATVAFTMSDAGLAVDETWHLSADRGGIDLDVARSYTSEATIEHNGQLRIGWARVWDNIRRPADGGNLPIGNAYTGRNSFFLSEPDDRYGVEQDDFVMLANAQQAALSVQADTNRSSATEFAYLNDGNTYQETQLSSADDWHYTAGTADTGLVYGGHSSNSTDAYIYSPVDVTAGQEDKISYRFSADDYADYYDLGGTIKGVDNTAALSSMLNDFGRSGMIDTDYGMSTVGLRYPGVGPYDMAFADRTVIGYGEEEMIASHKKLLEFFRDTGQLDSGHLRGRTFHLDHPWADDSLYDADAAYALSVAQMYDEAPDSAWLAEMRDSVEAAFAYMLSERYNENTGYFVNDATSCTQNHGAREWNDSFFVRKASGYVNELMYAALTQWASLEKEVFDDSATAADYTATAAKLKEQFNKSTDDGGLWDAETGMFAYWSCDGTAQVNVQHTQINLRAISFGLADLKRSKQILDGIDAQMQRTELPLIPMNFWPITYADEWSGDHFQSGLEDGSIYPFMTEEYARAAAVVGERERTLTYINNALELYTRDGYNGYSYVTWTGAPKSQEAWFPSNANVGTGLYLDVLGINATAEGVEVAPNIPTDMVGTSITQGVHGGSISVDYTGQLSQTVTYRAEGETVTMSWSGQKPGKTYTVRDDGSTHRVVADDYGTVRYSFDADGKHALRLVGGVADGYELPDQPDNLAYGANVEASSSLEDSRWGTAHLTDGNPFSADGTWGWSSDASDTADDSQSVTLDLGRVATVSSVVLDPRAYDGRDVGGGFPADFTVETSRDGKTWTTVVEETGFAQPTGREQPSFSIDPRRARYVRVTGTSLTLAKNNDTDVQEYRMQFAEIEVY